MLPAFYRFYLVFLSFLPALSIHAQDIAVGNWQVHLPYQTVKAVAESGNRIYAATGHAAFYFDKSDNSLTRMSKVTGLSDVLVSSFGYRASGDILVITYSNANIDVVKAGTVYNLPDIKRKNIPGDKKIYSVTFFGAYAYLSCGFGIVVLDVDKNEIKDTYTVSVNPTAVNQVAMLNDTVYAATNLGLYLAPYSGTNLSDYNSWALLGTLPAASYTSLTSLNGKLYAIQSNNPGDSILNDSIFMRTPDGMWGNFAPGLSETIHSVTAGYNRILVAGSGTTYVYDENGLLLNTYANPVDPRQAILDQEGNIWIADYYAGLIRNNATWGTYPNGPGTGRVYHMAFGEEDLWVAPGGRTSSWNNAFISDGLFSFVDKNWVSSDYADYNYVKDFIRIAVDPSDKKHVYAGSWGYGISELLDGVIINTFNETTTDTVLQSAITGENYCRIGGMDFDGSGNLWVSSSEVENLLCVKKPNNNWIAFQFQGLGPNMRIGDVLVDELGYKWVLIPGKGILVFNDNGTLGNSADDQDILLVNAVGSGSVSVDVLSIAEDLDGEIWVGTNEGVYVFYSPSLVFTNQDFDAQQILVEQDGYYQYLLETEAVTAIEVDGANRKWFGTENAGVFLMSEDGTTELLHFTAENSPLLSNSIITIAINQVNGEVFFGTDKGIISYKSTATEGAVTHTDVYAYPNPVREGYTGTIAIKGLVTDADVKITDISGALIYETKALGGQAIWDGKNFSGDKAQTGIYLVFAANEMGTETVVTKILLID